MRSNKLFIGQFLRDLRTEHALTQAKFGEKLGISTSYLNQIENNQRHVTATVLLALAEQFSVDIASISKHDSNRLLADLVECFADPLFKGKTPSSHELRLTAQNSPGVARSLITMQQALRRTSDQLVGLDDSISRSGSLSEPTPYEEVREYFHFINNYLHDLDLKAEQLASLLDTNSRSSYQALIDYIGKQHAIEVIEQNSDQFSIRDYDESRNLLKLNRRSSQATRSFHIAHQIVKAEFMSSEAAHICRIGIANYFAGATLMPYAEFHAAAKQLRHDLVHLADRFESSIEQVAHRLSTLQRPGLNGVPIFFARVDRAGNITKRHSATKLQFARFGSGCPLWNARPKHLMVNAICAWLARSINRWEAIKTLLATTPWRWGAKCVIWINLSIVNIWIRKRKMPLNL